MCIDISVFEHNRYLFMKVYRLLFLHVCTILIIRHRFGYLTKNKIEILPFLSLCVFLLCTKVGFEVKPAKPITTCMPNVTLILLVDHTLMITR